MKDDNLTFSDVPDYPEITSEMALQFHEEAIRRLYREPSPYGNLEIFISCEDLRTLNKVAAKQRLTLRDYVERKLRQEAAQTRWLLGGE